MRKKFFIFIFIILFLFASKNAFADQDNTPIQVSVSPAVIDLRIDKTKVKETEVNVFNHEPNPVLMKIYSKSFIPHEAIPEDKINLYDASKWISISPSETIINPNESKIIKINIKAPIEAVAGGHYATIYFESIKQNDPTSSINISKRVGVITMLTIDGNVIRKIEADSFKFNQLTLTGPSQFSINFSNDGNVHQMPGGSIVIEDINHNEIRKIPLPMKLVLPFTKREIIIPNEESLSSGIYFVKAEIFSDNGNNKIIPSFFIVISKTILFSFIILLTLINTSLIISWRKFGKATQILLKK